MKTYEKPVAEVIELIAEEIMGEGGVDEGPSFGGGTGTIPGM